MVESICRTIAPVTGYSTAEFQSARLTLHAHDSGVAAPMIRH